MTIQNQIYKCGLCGNLVEIIFPAGGTLVCCGQEMNLLEENTSVANPATHTPVVEKNEGGVKIKVGSSAHPMEEGHFIQWIEILWMGKTAKALLKPGDNPEAVFAVSDLDNGVTARAYCNLHGLWKS